MDEKKYIKRKQKALKDGNRVNYAIACNILGDYYNKENKYENALEEYLEAAEMYTKVGKQLELAKCNRMVGEMYMSLCRFEDAQKHIDIYLETVILLHNKVEEQRAYTTMGRAHLLWSQELGDMASADSQKQLKLAEKAFLKSLLLIKEVTGQISKLEQFDMQARCYLNIGVVKEHMEDYSEASEYIEKAIKLSVMHDLFELTNLSYLSMSLLHMKNNNTTLALRYCNMAIEVAKRLPNKVHKICEALLVKSEVLIKSTDFVSAKQILTKAYLKNTPDENDRKSIEKSLRIVVKICDILDQLVVTSSCDYAEQKKLYEQLGDGCTKLSNYAKAAEYYMKALEFAKLHGDCSKELIPLYVSLSQTYKDNKDYEKALEYFWLEFEANKDVPKEAFHTLCNIAEVFEIMHQSFQRIYETYDKAKEFAERAGLARLKLERIVYERQLKLVKKHFNTEKLHQLEKEMATKGIDMNRLDDDESESECEELGQNTPELGDDVCLEDLVDSETSDLDETEKPRLHRPNRGVRQLTLKRNMKGETQLHQACIAGNLMLARSLIDQGHTVNVRDHAGWLPLHEACNHGFHDLVELLLDKGAAVAINDKGGTNCDGITPLYDACSNGYMHVVELLLDRGADARVITDFGDTCVDGLDKWRRTASLTDAEQQQYAQLRSVLLERLTNAGLGKNVRTKPLTNADVDLNSTKHHGNSDAADDDEDDDDTLTSSPKCTPNSSSIHRRIEANRSGERKSLMRSSNKSGTSRASFEYKNVMEHVKHPNRLNSLDDVRHVSGGKQKRSALLKSTEVDDDWLIDDIGPEKKKQRYLSSPTSGVRLTSQNIPNDVISTNGDSSEDCPGIGSTFQRLFDAQDYSGATLQRQKVKSMKKLSLSRTSSVGSSSLQNRSKVKQQSSLLENGFCRFRSESSLSSEDSNGLENVAVSSTTATVRSPAKLSPIKVPNSSASVIPSTTSFRVNVEQQLLLVPVEDEKLSETNIRWLAEEAARRYNNLIGKKPVLRLTTQDGFAFEDKDPVTSALQETVILATVLDWEIPPMAKKYEQLCMQLKRQMVSNVRSALQRAQGTTVLRLEGNWLTPIQTEPIFKTLWHQLPLTVIDLQNNFIQNDGCRQLARALVALKHISSLNLKGNLITSDGLNAIFDYNHDDMLPMLEFLDLSHNPFGNSGLRILDKFCRGKNCLERLYLSTCELTEMYECNLRFAHLIEFDISFNALSEDSFQYLLHKLNASRLQSLNVSFTKDPHVQRESDHIVNFFQSGTCEKFKHVKLADCDLSNWHVLDIKDSLMKANQLETLDLCSNSKLESSLLQQIINDWPQLRRLVAFDCMPQKHFQWMIDCQIPSYLGITLDGTELEYGQYLIDLEDMFKRNGRSKPTLLHRRNHLTMLRDRDRD